MTKNEWYDAGDQIIKAVQNAVDTGNFSGLGGEISRAVNGASGTSKNGSFSLRLSQKVPGDLSSKAMKYLGFAAAVIFGILCFLFVIIASSMRFFFVWDIANTFGVLFVISLLVGAFGQHRVQVRRRLMKYVQIVGTRTYCALQDLADEAELSLQYIRSDLKRMIQRGFFVECYLDQQETVLITNRETYQQYLATQSSYEDRRKKEAQEEQNKEEEERKTQNSRSPEHQKLIDDGKNYIRHIHECNDRIPGEEMTEKLNRLELVVSRIFAAAENDPDSVSDLRKMMSYYLPTTQKLLDAYCDLENEPIAGQNMESTRKEIENALDMINTAFENLLDSLYADKAWDISSDISVLNTMLAQEGLTNDDISNKAKQSNTGGTA